MHYRVKTIKLIFKREIVIFLNTEILIIKANKLK